MKLILISGVVLVPSLVLLAPVLQFYLGSRSDLYFNVEEPWVDMARRGGILFLLGGTFIWTVSFIGGALILGIDMMGYASYVTCFGGMGIAMGWWCFAPFILRRFPPAWVSELEREHSRDDQHLILIAGSAMWLDRPRQFRRIIASRAGWECWLLTTTDQFPQITLGIYEGQIEQAIEKHWYPRALKFASDMVRLCPEDARGYLFQARVYVATQQLEKAIIVLSACIASCPEEARAYVARGRLYQRLGQSEHAAKDFERARLLDPELAGSTA